jgi:hypothetical protein
VTWDGQPLKGLMQSGFTASDWSSLSFAEFADFTQFPLVYQEFSDKSDKHSSGYMVSIC